MVFYSNGKELGMASAPAVELVSADDALNLLQKVGRVGGDPAAILARAGVLYSFAALSGGAVRYLTRPHMAALYRECIVDNKPQMHPDEFRLLCHCVITCHSLRDVIARQMMFFRTRGERLSALTLTTSGGVATLAVDTLRRRKSFGGFLSDLAGLAAFSRLYAWLTGMGVHHFRAGLAYGAPFTHEPVADFFAGIISFNHPINNIIFPEWLLSMPVVRTPAALETLLREFPFDFMAPRPAELKLSDRIRNLYSLALTRDGSLPSLKQLAGLAGLGLSTLRRMLLREGVSLRVLKDSARRDAALVLVQQRHLSIEQISNQTGFRDTDSFRAAFRRWTGLSPSRYRARPAPTPKLVKNRNGNPAA
jgi:AraC-like DNA-binding protein